MDEIESIAQLFIVRIWVEECAEEGSRGILCEHITHMPGGERRYLKNLNEIRDFISPYLERIGKKPWMRWRMRRWLRRLSGRS